MADLEVSPLTPLPLKNGSMEPKATVVAVMMSLDGLWNSGLPGMLAVYDLIGECKGEGKVSGNALKTLQDYSLIDSNGSIHDSIKNIVLSAAIGEGFNTSLGNPVKKD